MSVTLVVQSRAFTSGVLLLTIGELATQVVLFILSIKYGMGGLTRLDIACYGGFIMSLSVYLLTRNAALSLTLLVVTDFIAFLPTLVKIWRDPTSDTWMVFVVGGMAAAAASLLAHSTNHYIELIFPTYLFIANALAALPILLYNKRMRGRTTLSTPSRKLCNGNLPDGRTMIQQEMAFPEEEETPQ